MRIYCDSVILIYLLEGAAPNKARASAHLSALWAAGDIMVVSDLVRLECRMLPIRQKDVTSLADYDAFFGQSNVEVVPIGTREFDVATTLRAESSLKLADALHLAAAICSQCDLFLTHDRRLGSFTGISVEVLP